MATDLRTGVPDGFVNGRGRMVSFNGNVYFFAPDPADLTKDALFRENSGTVGGAERVLQLAAGEIGGDLVAAGGRMYFTSNRAAVGSHRLWTGAGTPSTTVSVASQSSPFLGLTAFQEHAFWYERTSQGWGLLKRSAGTGSVPAVVKGFNWDVRELTVTNDGLYFAANDSFSARKGVELWRIDTPSATPRILTDLMPGTADSNPRRLVAAVNRLYFTATTYSATLNRAVDRLYLADGDAVTEIADGLSSLDELPIDAFEQLENVGETLYFYARNHPRYGSDLWKTDGTVAGTIPLDLAPGTASYPVREMREAGGLLYLVVGSSGATQVDLVAIDPGDGDRATQLRRFSSQPRALAEAGDALFFAAIDASLSPNPGEELWSSKGTSESTQLVKDIFQGGSGSGIRGPIIDSSGLACFSADNGVNGDELWKALPAGIVSPALVSFARATSVALENSESLVVDVVLSEPASRSVSVRVAREGTATEGVDYTANPTVVVFEPGVTRRTVTLAVAEDVLPESDESTVLRLVDPVGVRLGAQDRYTHTIVDDDSTVAIPVTVSFATSTSRASEGAVAPIAVRLSGPANRWILVDVTTTGGTATPGLDFAPPSPSTLAFAPGETNATITIAVSADAPAELPETVLLELRRPANALLGSGVRHTLTITDPAAPIVQWDGGGNDFQWTNPLNWDGDALPGPNAVVVIDTPTSATIEYSGSGTAAVRAIQNHERFRMRSGTLSVRETSTFASDVYFDGGVLDGAGDVDVKGMLEWRTGMLKGSGTTRALGGVRLVGAGSRSIFGRRFENQGRAEWDGGSLLTGSTTVDSVEHDGVWINTPDAETIRLSGNFRFSGDFENRGSFKQNGSSITQFIGSFLNAGTFEVVSGSLEIAVAAGSTSINSGDIDVAAGSELFLNIYHGTSFHNATGSRMAVAGGLIVHGGTNSRFRSDSNVTVGDLTLFHGAIEGTGDVVVKGSLDWRGTLARGAGGVSFEGSRGFIGRGAILDRPFVNGGSLTVDGVASSADPDPVAIDVRSKGFFRNIAGGVVEFVRGRILNAGTIENRGLISVLGVTSIVSASNPGVIRVEPTGSLDLLGGWTSGAVVVATGGAIAFEQEHELRDGAEIVGTIEVRTGPALNGKIPPNLRVTGRAGVQHLRLLSGAIDGPGTLDATETFTWDGGTLSGSGVLRILNVGELTLGGFARLDGRIVENLGFTRWTGANTMISQGTVPGTWINRAGGTLEIGASRATFHGAALRNEPGAVLINNQPSSLAEAIIEGDLRNDGRIEARRGRLTLMNLLNHDAQTRTLAGGTYVVKSPSYLHALRDGVGVEVERLDATITLEGAYARFRDGGTSDVIDNLREIAENGALNLINRNLTIVGVLENRGRLFVEDAAFRLRGALTNLGEITLAGASELWTNGAAVNDGSVTLGPSSIMTVYLNTFTQNERNSLAARPTLTIQAASASRYGRLRIGKQATLRGRLFVERVPGSAISPGAKLTIVTFASRSALFDEVLLPAGWSLPTPSATAKSLIVLTG